MSKKSNISAADFSALTASSKLQHLSLSRCWLPAGVWQHMFPAGRQLPQLRSLKITYVRERPSRDTATAEKVLQMAQRKQLTRLAFDGKCWTHKVNYCVGSLQALQVHDVTNLHALAFKVFLREALFGCVNCTSFDVGSIGSCG